jgi:hypothetical protein
MGYEQHIVLSRFWDRGLTDLELERVRQLAALHTPEREIAHSLGFGLQNWRQLKQQNPQLTLLINRARAESAEALRKAQFQSALSGNTQMQIWLGRALLHQNATNDPQDGSVPTAAALSDLSPEARQSLRDLRDQIYAHADTARTPSHSSEARTRGGDAIEVEAQEIDSQSQTPQAPPSTSPDLNPS